MPSPAPNQILQSPDWLAHRYDPGYDAVHFVAADRSLRRAAPFLIDAHLPAATDPIVLGRKAALELAPAAAPIHFIFHSAYCCSTLLANALDRPGLASAFKEPTILNDIVGWRHRGGAPDRIGPVLDQSLSLLSRPFGAGEASVIKPSNVVNGLASAMLSMRPEAGCVLLYAPLRVYLGSIAAKGMWGRLWVRDLFTKQLKDGLIELGFAPEDHMLQTDLQIAALGWLAQHRLFTHLAQRWPERVRTLDSEILLSRPAQALAAIGALFGLALDAATIADIVKSDAFNRHAKDGGSFSSADRKAGQAAAAALHGDELEKVAIWAETVAASAGLPMQGSRPLLP